MVKRGEVEGRMAGGDRGVAQERSDAGCVRTSTRPDVVEAGLLEASDREYPTDATGRQHGESRPAHPRPAPPLGSDETIFGNHHVYVEGVDWIDRSHVKIRVSGYGDADPNGFTLLYEYPVGGRFRLLKRTASFGAR